ncbi:MAG: Fpg/Nei family DNA glycosylase [Deltaproteobacteria bacterium]|nr:Fpg/Nei family DNA glycosylase [Deltaproteobacteria bacterium]
MPELPEVEIARRNLERHTGGGEIVALEPLPGADLEGDVAHAVGAVLARWERHGKLLVGRLAGGGAVLSHLGMTGKWVRDADDRPHQRVLLAVRRGDDVARVSLVDPRRLGWVRVTDDPDAWLDRLGPDALDPALDAATLAARAGGGRVPLKTRLLDQARVAGLGNICVLEACFRAGVHPHTPAGAVPPAAWERLLDGARAHIAHTLEVEAGEEITYLSEGGDNPFLVYGRAGSPCPRCAAPIARDVLAGRPTFFCPTCQPAPAAA